MKVNQPLYLSLYEKLKNQIIEGQYQSNDRFPSKRQLSNYLSVSHTTIEHAYQLLVDEVSFIRNLDLATSFPI